MPYQTFLVQSTVIVRAHRPTHTHTHTHARTHTHTHTRIALLGPQKWPLTIASVTLRQILVRRTNTKISKGVDLYDHVHKTNISREQRAEQLQNYCVAHRALIRSAHAAALAIDRYLLLAGPTTANLQQLVCCYVPMLGQTLYRFIDLVPHTMRAVPKIITRILWQRNVQC